MKGYAPKLVLASIYQRLLPVKMLHGLTYPRLISA